MDDSKKQKVLTSFVKSTRAVADLMKQENTLDLEDQRLIQNHLLIVQLAYTTYKSRTR